MKQDGAITHSELEGFVEACMDNGLSVCQATDLVNLWTSGD